MRRLASSILAVALVVGSVTNAHAAVQLITNGNFETGTFAGWTVADQTGGSGSWLIDNPGTTTPISGQSTVGNPGGGTFYAVTDQGGPGAHVLLQSFVVPLAATSVTLTFEMFANDLDSGPIVNPAGLDFTAGANQHARVDILTASAGSFSTAPADVVLNAYLGVDGGPDPHAFTSYTVNLSSLTPGTAYQLRFGEVDNQFFFNVGVDNVSILAETASVPEPVSLASWSAFGLMGLAVGAAKRLRNRS